MAIKKINVSSLDFDGCLGNENYQNNKDVVAANHSLCAHLLDKVKLDGFTDAVLMVGSNRQDLDTEYTNSEKKGIRCFPTITEFQCQLNNRSKKIKFNLDKFLLGDKSKHQSGKTFRAGSKKSPITKQQAQAAECYYFDDSKVTLLYAQMHRMASLHPDAEITFDFYDDKENILRGLLSYYKNNPTLLPPRMKLRVYQYDGGNVNLIGEVSDADVAKERYIDRNYMQTVDKMIECAGHNPLAVGAVAENNPPASMRHDSPAGSFGVLNNLKTPNATEKFKIERNLLNLNKYLDKEIKRLNHWYIWRGREKANLLLDAKNSINADAKNQATYDAYKTLYTTHGLFAAITFNRHKISEKQKVRPESTYNYMRKFLA